MDPIFSVLVEVARLTTRQPPAIKQTWGVPECMPQPEAAPDEAAKPIRDLGPWNWLLCFSLRPR